MELVMTIGDVVSIPNVGSVIVGGNLEITKDNTTKLCKKGDDIIVYKGNEKLKFEVMDIKLSFSLSERVIISIKLKESKDFNKLNIGDLVYKI